MRAWLHGLGWLEGEAPELEVRQGPVAIHGSRTVVLTLVLLICGNLPYAVVIPEVTREQPGSPWPLQGLAQASAEDCRTPHPGGWRL